MGSLVQDGKKSQKQSQIYSNQATACMLASVKKKTPYAITLSRPPEDFSWRARGPTTL